MSVIEEPLPETDVKNSAATSTKRVDEVRTGGWVVRITIAVIVILWLIPTVGVLVTSFRPEALVDSTGWWTALAHPFRAAEWTLENYRLALNEGFGNAFLNSLAVTIPSTVIPITIAAFAAIAVWVESGDEPTAAPSTPASIALGRQVFATTGCAGCHTLADAGATGTVGPDLDAAEPSAALVSDRVTNGLGVMPSFAGKLSTAQIAAVAAYVSSTAGK